MTPLDSMMCRDETMGKVDARERMGKWFFLSVCSYSKRRNKLSLVLPHLHRVAARSQLIYHVGLKISRILWDLYSRRARNAKGNISRVVGREQPLNTF
jgi:hypothetical protein